MYPPHWSVVLIAVGMCVIPLSVKGQSAPNVIFIMTDDLGPGEYGIYDNLQIPGEASRIDTPNIQRLAEGGMRFNNAHAATALCATTRAAVLAGAPTWQTNVRWGLGTSSLLPGQQSVGELMQAAGYRTAMMGKGHIGGEIYAIGSNSAAGNSLANVPNMDLNRPLKDGPTQHGYDYTVHLLAGHQAGPYLYWENDLATTIDANGNSLRITNDNKVAMTRQWNAGYDDGVTEIWPLASGWGVTDWNTRDVPQTMLHKAVGFMNETLTQSPEQPFFLHYNSIAGHWPYVAPANVQVDINGNGTTADPGESYVVDGYNGTGPAPDDRGTESMQMVSVSDAEVGVLLSYLEQTDDPRNPGKKLVDNTMLIYTSDNGGIGKNYNHASYGLFDTEEWNVYRHESTGALAGNKGFAEEGGHRVPFIVQWPGQIAEGVVLDQRISNIDLMGTLAGLTGQNLIDQGPGSHNLLPVFLGLRDDSDPVRQNLIVEDTGGDSDNQIARNLYYEDGFKLHLGRTANNPQLFAVYDLANDPSETNNLLNSTDPDVQARVATMYANFNLERSASRMAPVFIGRDSIVSLTDVGGRGDIMLDGELAASGTLVGDLDVNSGGVVRVVSGNGTPSTLSIAPTQDISIRSGKPTTNFNSQRLGLGQTAIASDGVARVAIEFDLTTLGLPPGAVVQSAELVLTNGFNWNLVTESSSPTIEFYPLTQAFNEATATWNSAATGTPWTTAGGAFDPQDLIGTITGFDPDTLTINDQIVLDGQAFTDFIVDHSGKSMRLLMKYDGASEADDTRSAIWPNSLQNGSPLSQLIVSYTMTGNERLLSVTGDYAQRSDSQLILTLGNGEQAGTDYDQLHVGGNLRLLGGSLILDTDSDFAPGLGDIFQILQFDTIEGGFTSILLPDLPMGMAWSTSQLLIDGNLAIVPSLPGDYNNDQVVDLADYTVWRDSLGAAVLPWEFADGNGDRVVDARDYTIWKDNFGNQSPTLGSATTVPEPASLVLAIAGLLCVLNLTGPIEGLKSRLGMN